MKHEYANVAGATNQYAPDPVITFDHMQENRETMQQQSKLIQLSTIKKWFLAEAIAIAVMLGICIWISF
jgi:hypothetical protein